MGARIDLLVADLCGAPEHPLAARLQAWAQDSRAFAAFLEENAGKVRRKLRVTDVEALADVQAELAVAAWVVRERRWTLTPEPLAASGGRGPDFRVAAPDGGGAFGLEVTRLRGVDGVLPLRLARTLADKVRQLPTGTVNLLAVVLSAGVDGPDVLAGAIRVLERAAQQAGEPPPGVDGRGFARGRARLSGVLLGTLDDTGRLRTTLHPLRGARHLLPPDTARRLRALG